MDDTLPNLFGDSYLENTCNQGISPSFSFEEFGKTMDEYIQGGRISQVPSRINIDDVINEKAKSKREPKLKLSMRPADLINNIDCLLSKIPTPTLTPNPEFSRINFNLPVMNYTKKEVIRPTTTSSFAKIPIHMKMNNYIYHDSKKRRRKNAKKPTPLFLLT
ncbi:hypothetical protein TRFO_38755 [Tritrichomonas foetus]|uniref:Uncharacterized protein n=1 Tax=Tritrichomonas foetus TaxID=1144522 RepID=A0A1J4JCC4_9EUKA|nr:hypothetical protein TRFO_38755 [Tritrichomonas foetus]|eukprot:OHS95061.1 hypothetical protein TRFO_38755 [Tritrichomonas foetus]